MTPLTPGRYVLQNGMRVTLIKHPTKPHLLLCADCTARGYSGRLEFSPSTGQCLKPAGKLGFAVARPVRADDKTLAPRNPHEDD